MTVTNYHEFTIGELMQTLKQAVENNSFLSYDSPVFVSDYNMSGFMYEVGVAPTYSSKHHTAGLGIFHTLKSEFEDVEVEIDEYGKEVQKEEKNYIMQEEEPKDEAFMKFVRSVKQ